MHGQMISLEGIDFTWKTPIAEQLKTDLSDLRDLVISRDPPYKLSPWDSSVEFFEREEGISKIAEALMLLSARLDNFERVISPALESGKLVVMDRYLDSWFAYQTMRISCLFDGDCDRAREFLFALNDLFIRENLLKLPDLTILIQDDPERTILRKVAQKIASKYDFLDVQKQVDVQYRRLVQIFPERLISIDVSKLDIEGTYSMVKQIVRSWLARGFLFPSADRVNSGDRIMSLQPISWTIGQYEDFPLWIKPGELGAAARVSQDGRLFMDWESDNHKRLPKTLNLGSDERYKVVLI